MIDIDFNFTADGSVGMYDKVTKDIFHSVTGAKQESIDKFINSTDYENFLSKNSFANVLDICFGIGYNTKSAIFFALKNNSKINILALELSKEVAYLSPFIIDGFNSPNINIYLLANFLLKFEDFSSYISDYFLKNPIITENYFHSDIIRVFNTFINSDVYFSDVEEIYSFLHNICYQNISDSMKKILDTSICKNITFDIIFSDARISIQGLKNNYFDFVFLDAFTPHKQPLLWTYNFLQIVKSKMNQNSILATYSNSTSVRKTFSDLGFYVGKILLEEKQFGSVATMDKNKIKVELTEYDIGLMNTKAGIPYRDEFLNLSSCEILKNRDNELKACDIMSATEYKRKFSDAQI